MRHILIILVLIISSCTTAEQKECIKNNDTIEVCFLRGERDTSIPVNCNEFAKSVQDLNVDTTIFISKILFDELNKVLVYDKQMDTLYCDARILIQMDSLRLCICDMGYIYNSNGKHTVFDLELIHKLKTVIGYYNYMPKKLLLYQKEIEMFGIPRNYKYYNEDKHMDTITLIKDLGKPVKVRLVKK